MKYITRFAPSPTGNPHVGNIRTALFDFLAAKSTGGEFLLRIEDTDRARFVRGSIEYIHEALAWLGLTFDGEVTYQSDRLSVYQKVADELILSGNAYKCFCTSDRLEKLRADQVSKKLPPAYDGLCRNLSETEITEREKSDHKYVIRFAMPDKGNVKWRDLVRGNVEIAYKEMDDFIILKSDKWPTYHLANVIDDHESGINCVIRGEEWIPSTPKHLRLYEVLGWEPPFFAHMPVTLGSDKQKLSKRNGDSAILDYKAKGYLPEALINFLVLLGWSSKSEDEIFTLKELENRFRLEDVNKSPAVFDIERLNWINGLYIRKLTVDELTNRLIEFDKDLSKIDRRLLERVVKVEQSRMKTLLEFAELVAPYRKIPEYNPEMLVFKKSSPEATKKGLRALYSSISEVKKEDWSQMTVDGWNALLTQIVEDNKLNNADVFWPIRVALSGLEKSASPAELLWVLGKEVSMRRLKEII
jgi:glutamyl-tRNA synthetase